MAKKIERQMKLVWKINPFSLYLGSENNKKLLRSIRQGSNGIYFHKKYSSRKKSCGREIIQVYLVS